MAESSVTCDKIEDCEVCGENKAKYTCPKCEVRTCCLQCVNIHKKELKCDGIRDKTKYVPLNSFTDLDILSDYRLLEEVGRRVEQLKRNPLKKCTSRLGLPLHLSKLKTAAFRRKTFIKFMPKHFSRHKSNTTFFDWKTNKLFWKIEWIFPQAEHTKWITEKALDSKRLSLLVEEVLYPMESLANKNDIAEINLKKRLNDRLQFYQAAGLPEIKVLLKAERVTQSDLKFYELDVTLTLKENLENKTIIEFPTIYIVLKDHSYIYKIIDTDEEDASKNKNGCSLGKRNYKKGNLKKAKNSPVNYFFNSELSDSEDEKPSAKRKTKCMSDFNIPDYDTLVKM